jgi:hypothetical protein
MSFEELLQEHIKALKENTKAIKAYTSALGGEKRMIEVEHTKESACRFCGITHKTMQNHIESGLIVPCRRKNGKREFFKEADLVAMCETRHLYAGEYGAMRTDPKSIYYTNN